MSLKVLTSDYIYDNIPSDGLTFYTEKVKIYVGNLDESDNSITGHFKKQDIDCSITANWITAAFLDPDTTNTYTGIKITVSENTGTTDRSGRIYLTYNDYTTPNCILINQKGNPVTEINIKFEINAIDNNGNEYDSGGTDGNTFFGTAVDLTPGINFPNDIEVNEKAGTVYFKMPNGLNSDYLYNYLYNKNNPNLPLNLNTSPTRPNGFGSIEITYNSTNPLRYVKFDKENPIIKVFPADYDPSDKIYAYINGVAFNDNDNNAIVYMSRSCFEFNTSNVLTVKALVIHWNN